MSDTTTLSRLGRIHALIGRRESANQTLYPEPMAAPCQASHVKEQGVLGVTFRHACSARPSAAHLTRRVAAMRPEMKTLLLCLLAVPCLDAAATTSACAKKCAKASMLRRRPGKRWATDEGRLIDELLHRSDYFKFVRPVKNASDQVRVGFGLSLTMIMDMVSPVASFESTSMNCALRKFLERTCGLRTL